MRNKIIATLGVFVICGLSYATQQVINNSPAGGGTGDTLYTAFGKVNDNFDELYANMTNYVSFTNTITGFTNTITSFSASQLTNANAYDWRDGLELWEQVTNTTALGWRSALALGEQTTNTTAAAWRSAIGLSQHTTNANLAIAAGTSGFVPLYSTTNSIGNSLLFANSVNYGLAGGLRIGSTNGTAGNSNLVVDGTISVGVIVNTNYPYYAVNKGTNNGSAVLASKNIPITDGTLLNGIEFFSFDNNIAAPGLSSAYIRAYASSSHGAANVGSYMMFSTATDGSTNVVDRLRIGKTGDITVLTSGALLAVDSVHVGGTSAAGDNNLVVDGNTYVAGTAYANAVRGTNYYSADGTVGITTNAVIDVSGTNYTFAIKNGLITGFSRTP